MTALVDDELDPQPVAGWNLPLDVDGFWDWLRAALPAGSLEASWTRFKEIPAYQQMPPNLKDAVIRDLYGT